MNSFIDRALIRSLTKRLTLALFVSSLELDCAICWLWTFIVRPMWVVSVIVAASPSFGFVCEL